jgi:hypothetical protein
VRTLPFGDKIASMRTNLMGALQEKKFGFNKKRFFNRNDIRGLQTRINIHLMSSTQYNQKESTKEQVGVRKKKYY